MKEIKFRVYDKQSNEMIYLEPPLTYDNGLWFKSDKHIDSEDIVIMQFTGLTDCEGKEIFEGDIIEVEFDDYYSNNYFTIDENEKCIGEIVFDYFGYYIKFPDMCFMPINDVVDYDFNIYYKILGNIHQNSELLVKNK